MNEDSFRSMLNSRPLWSDIPAANALPVPVRTTYTVMGRINKLWETILPATEDLYIARQTMDAANAAKHFDRIVITQGNSALRGHSGAWTTIECALPPHGQIGKTLYKDMLREMQSKAANNNITKQSQSFLLALACLFGALLQSPAILGFVACLAVIDCLFLLDKTRIGHPRIAQLNRQRNWAYSLLNGCLLAFILLKFLP